MAAYALATAGSWVAIQATGSMNSYGAPSPVTFATARDKLYDELQRLRATNPIVPTNLDRHVKHKWCVDFQEKLKDRFGLDDERVALVLASMRRNLEHGNLKFVVLMDSMDDRLGDMIT